MPLGFALRSILSFRRIEAVLEKPSIQFRGTASLAFTPGIIMYNTSYSNLSSLLTS